MPVADHFPPRIDLQDEEIIAGPKETTTLKSD
jgi:hypothetical protein